MSAVEFVQITKTELEAVVFEATLKAFNKGMEMAQEQDLMLNMSEICEKTQMSEYVFRQLRDKHKIPCVGGRYSMAKVRKAMQT